MDIENFGKRLREAREKASLQQNELSDLSGVPKSTISKIEGGGQSKSGDVGLLAHHLGVNAYWLSHGIGPMYHLSANLANRATDEDEYMLQFADSRCKFGPNYGSEESIELPCIAYPKVVFEQCKITPNECFSFVSTDRSMGDVGDTYLVNTLETKPQEASGKTFAIEGSGTCVIRHIFYLVTGEYKLVCDSPDKVNFSDVLLSEQEMSKLNILGRVRYQSGFR